MRLSLSTEPPATAAIGVVLSPQPQVQVLDANGSAVTSRGVLVTASIASGGGALAGTTETRTDLNGRAVFTDLALIGPVGSRALRFSAQGLAAAISRAIDAAAGPVTSAVIQAGNNQTAPAGTVVPVAPAVRVTDGSDNPIAGVPVNFTVTGGGGSIMDGSQVTNAQGVATLGQWVLGTSIGPNSLSAAVTGLASPIAFSATAVIGPATEIIRLEGDGQTATIGGAVPIAPTVKVTDGFGNVISGLAVNFVPADGSGSVSGNPAITDASGVARLGSWRLGLAPGFHTLNATSQGAIPASFTATGVDFPVSLIAAGVSHSCAVDANGAARCWGANAQGQLGNGTSAGDSLPVFVTNGTGFTQIVAGTHSCGLGPTGVARCWGPGSNGQLGDGTNASRSIPVFVSGGFSFSQLTAGVLHTCGLRSSDGRAFCWGAGANGRLGVGGTGSRSTPTEVIGGHSYSVISAGVAHTCGVRTDGVLFCWGQNTEGRLGDNTIIERQEPTPVVSAITFTGVSAGGGHTCALDSSGAAWCWGVNSSGQLGDGTLTSRLVPAAVLGGRTYSLITTGTAHTCALASDGTVWCWGENSSS
ncbi:MAG TPA: Ig-like domain-containing protein, partial [Gemmatimonadales bacterium]